MGFNELEEIITSSDKFSEDFKSKLKKLGQVAALSGAIMAGSMGLTGCPSQNQSNPLPQITSIEIVDEVPNSDAQITYDYQNGFSGKIKASFDIGEPTEININNCTIISHPTIEKEKYGLPNDLYEDDTFDITINYGGKTTTATVKNNCPEFFETSDIGDLRDVDPNDELPNDALPIDDYNFYYHFSQEYINEYNSLEGIPENYKLKNSSGELEYISSFNPPEDHFTTPNFYIKGTNIPAATELTGKSFLRVHK